MDRNFGQYQTSSAVLGTFGHQDSQVKPISGDLCKYKALAIYLAKKLFKKILMTV